MSETSQDYITVSYLQKKEVSNLGERIYKARIADGRSMSKLCKAADISSNYWYRIESGKITNLPIETLQKIESVLGVNFGITFDD